MGQLQPKRFAMRMDLTRQMLNQSDPQLDAVIARDMSNAIANEVDEYIIGTKLFASADHHRRLRWFGYFGFRHGLRRLHDVRG